MDGVALLFDEHDEHRPVAISHVRSATKTDQRSRDHPGDGGEGPSRTFTILCNDVMEAFRTANCAASAPVSTTLGLMFR